MSIPQRIESRPADLPFGESTTLTFGRHVDGVMDESTRTMHDIVSALGSRTIKLKHSFIYSCAPGYGVSRVLNEFTRTHNAAVVNDLTNWNRVDKTAQFLIFEDYDAANCLPLSTLKAFTGGAALHRKAFGDSYAPREDVQLIILSNVSIYDVYGKYDAKLQRRFMSRDAIDRIGERCHVVRLDGDAAKDRRRAVHPVDWSDDEQREAIADYIDVTVSAPATTENTIRVYEKSDCRAIELEKLVHVVVTLVKTRTRDKAARYQVILAMKAVVRRDDFVYDLLELYRITHDKCGMPKKGKAKEAVMRNMKVAMGRMEPTVVVAAVTTVYSSSSDDFDDDSIDDDKTEVDYEYWQNIRKRSRESIDGMAVHVPKKPRRLATVTEAKLTAIRAGGTLTNVDEVFRWFDEQLK